MAETSLKVELEAKPKSSGTRLHLSSWFIFAAFLFCARFWHEFSFIQSSYFFTVVFGLALFGSTKSLLSLTCFILIGTVFSFSAGFFLRRSPHYFWVVPLPNRIDFPIRMTISFNVIVCHHSQLFIFVLWFRLILKVFSTVIIDASLSERWRGIKRVSWIWWLSFQSLIGV